MGRKISDPIGERKWKVQNILSPAAFGGLAHGVLQLYRRDTTDVDTTASVRLSKQGEGFAIDRIALTMQATVPGIDDATFQEIAAAAKRDCPLSKALASVPEITLVATLRPKTGS